MTKTRTTFTKALALAGVVAVALWLWRRWVWVEQGATVYYAARPSDPKPGHAWNPDDDGLCGPGSRVRPDGACELDPDGYDVDFLNSIPQ